MRVFIYTTIIVAVMLSLAAIAWLLSNSWFWHPLAPEVCRATYKTARQIRDCESYNLHSGIEANLSLLPLTTFFIGGLVALWRTYRRLECDVEAPNNCHKLGHKVPGTSHYACRTHHPHGIPRHSGITAEQLLEQHEKSSA